MRTVSVRLTSTHSNRWRVACCRARASARGTLPSSKLQTREIQAAGLSYLIFQVEADIAVKAFLLDGGHKQRYDRITIFLFLRPG